MTARRHKDFRLICILPSKSKVLFTEPLKFSLPLRVRNVQHSVHKNTNEFRSKPDKFILHPLKHCWRTEKKCIIRDASINIPSVEMVVTFSTQSSPGTILRTNFYFNQHLTINIDFILTNLYYNHSYMFQYICSKFVHRYSGNLSDVQLWNYLRMIQMYRNM